jgi:L-amino acid N-acyltransferase YncA
MTAARISIRLAAPADLQRINDIYNHYVLDSECTYQEEPASYQERSTWFAAHGSAYPVTVAERDGAIVAWASLSRFHPRSAYSKTVENSIYVQPDMHRQGIGSAMLMDLLVRAKALGHHTVLALIDSKQTGSIALHKRYGFEQSGHLKEVGYKFGRWLDVVYLQKMLT